MWYFKNNTFTTPPTPHFCKGLIGHVSVLCKHCPECHILESHILSLLKIKISNFFFLTHGKRGKIKIEIT